jgi:DNA polymerase-3 subunit delta'
MPPAASVAEPLDPWARVVGQDDAVEALRAAAASPVHAYLLVGTGDDKRAAALAFSAELLAAGLEGADRERAVELALDGHHPDLVVIEPDSNIFRGTADRQQGESPAQRMMNEAITSPREGARKVVVAVDFHLANDVAIGRLLKVIEEPPPSTVLVLLEDFVPPEQTTIASRCVRIDLRAAATMAVAAHEELWMSIPRRLDGTGARVHELVGEVQAALTEAEDVVRAAHAVEVEALREDIQLGRQPRGELRRREDANKRTLRRQRTVQLRLGLAALAVRYRDRLGTAERPAPLVASLQAIQDAAEALERNPIEELLLEALLLRLEPVSG